MCTMTQQHVNSCLAVPSRYVNVKKRRQIKVMYTMIQCTEISGEFC
jgi:peptide deformylase